MNILMCLIHMGVALLESSARWRWTERIVVKFVRIERRRLCLENDFDALYDLLLTRPLLDDFLLHVNACNDPHAAGVGIEELPILLLYQCVN